jgi:hypothetical protein
MITLKTAKVQNVTRNKRLVYCIVAIPVFRLEETRSMPSPMREAKEIFASAGVTGTVNGYLLPG